VHATRALLPVPLRLRVGASHIHAPQPTWLAVVLVYRLAAAKSTFHHFVCHLRIPRRTCASAQSILTKRSTRYSQLLHGLPRSAAPGHHLWRHPRLPLCSCPRDGGRPRPPRPQARQIDDAHTARGFSRMCRGQRMLRPPPRLSPGARLACASTWKRLVALFQASAWGGVPSRTAHVAERERGRHGARRGRCIAYGVWGVRRVQGGAQRARRRRLRLRTRRCEQ